MKTKTFFLTMIFISLSWISSASVVHVYLNNTGAQEWHYFCAVDSIIIHKPDTAMTNVRWTTPDFNYIYGVDSVIVTSSTTGSWIFYSNEVSKGFYVYILSSGPTTPTCMLTTDTSFCTASFSLQLDAENQNPGGQAASYFWSTGQTTQTITVTTPGTYTVTITNACGTGVYTKNVYHANPNAPQLGADQTFCWGQSSVLDPGSTNVSSYQWSTGETTPTITVDTTGTYWVYLVDNNSCSGRDTVVITALLPTPEEICFVEFDTLTWKNNINWTNNLPGNAEFVNVYKEVSLNAWNLIGTVAIGINNFIDTNSTPQSNSNSYRIALVDTCGNESSMSSPHTTITLISAYDPLSNTYGFSWSAYQGLIVSDYYLFGIDSSNNITQIASVPGNIFMYNYTNPSVSYIKYFVGFEIPDCNGTKSNVIVKSNWVLRDTALVAGIVQELPMLSFSAYPNPAYDILNVNVDLEDFHVEVITPLGQVVLTEHNTKVLDVNSLPQGIYVVRIYTNDKQAQKTFIKH